MSHFILRRCRILQQHFVSDKEETVLNFESLRELVRHFVPSNVPGQKRVLAGLRRGEFIGFSKRKDGQQQSVFRFTDPSGNLENIFSNDPSLEARIVECFRVERADYDARITEGAVAQATG